MLHQITWPQYLLFAAVALLIYYSAIWLICFRPDDNAPGTATPEPPEPEESGLLGEPVEEFGVSTLNSDELHFGPSRPKAGPEADEALSDEDSEMLQGDIADLLEDIKPAFDLIEENDPENKERLIGLIASQVKQYPRVLNSELFIPILQEICDNTLSELGLVISTDELQTAIHP